MMETKKYMVIDLQSKTAVAHGMGLEHAFLLIRALMEEYYNEPDLGYGVMVEMED